MLNLDSKDAALFLRKVYQDLIVLAPQYADDKEKPVGAVVFDWDSQGHVGFNVYPLGEEPKKDKSNIIHAEAMAIAAYDVSGSKSGIAIVVTTKAPCLGCARAIIDVNPSLVVMPEPEPNSSWFDEQNAAVVLFLAFNIKVAYAHEGLKHACK